MIFNLQNTIFLFKMFLYKDVGQATNINWKKLTVRQLAAIVDIDFGALSRIETGQKNSHILTLKAIADALKVEMKDFI
jgi:DNA-binding Xre family transcriptional regulator